VYPIVLAFGEKITQNLRFSRFAELLETPLEMVHEFRNELFR
jgi:hypothetical protein